MADLERKSQGYVNSQIAKSVKGSQMDARKGSPSDVSGQRSRDYVDKSHKKRNLIRGESHTGVALQ